MSSLSSAPLIPGSKVVGAHFGLGQVVIPMLDKGVGRGVRRLGRAKSDPSLSAWSAGN